MGERTLTIWQIDALRHEAGKRRHLDEELARVRRQSRRAGRAQRPCWQELSEVPVRRDAAPQCREPAGGADRLDRGPQGPVRVARPGPPARACRQGMDGHRTPLARIAEQVGYESETPSSATSESRRPPGAEKGSDPAAAGLPPTPCRVTRCRANPTYAAAGAGEALGEHPAARDVGWISLPTGAPRNARAGKTLNPAVDSSRYFRVFLERRKP